MLFQKKVEPRCAWCLRGETLDDEHAVCKKKGVVPLGFHCRAFRYDPLKRTPPRNPAPLDPCGKLPGSDEDFSL